MVLSAHWAFCCSRAHAERMAEEFCARNVPACAVYSDADGNFSEDRTAAIEKLEKGELKVIFSVDMFNEGVDIPSLDMVMFLRPRNRRWFFFSSWAGDCGRRQARSI